MQRDNIGKINACLLVSN